jgi:hypothetical protein
MIEIPIVNMISAILIVVSFMGLLMVYLNNSTKENDKKDAKIKHLEQYILAQRVPSGYDRDKMTFNICKN